MAMIIKSMRIVKEIQATRALRNCSRSWRLLARKTAAFMIQ
jgi:hypothetical protein